MTQDFFLGQLRLMAIATIAYAAGRGWLTSADSGFISALMIPIGLLFGPWLWSIYRNINMKLVPKDSVAIAADNVLNHATAVASGTAIINSDGMKGEAPFVKVVGAILLALCLSLFVQVGDAIAQGPVVRKVVKDLNATFADNAGAGPKEIVCGFQLFQELTISNVVNNLKTCGIKLHDGTKSALDSAKTANDGVAVACLTPALGMLDTVVAAPADQLPEVVLTFQKFREFVMAGGISNCKNWVNSTAALVTGSAL